MSEQSKIWPVVAVPGEKSSGKKVKDQASATKQPAVVRDNGLASTKSADGSGILFAWKDALAHGRGMMSNVKSLVVALALAGMALPAGAASVNKTYSYFSVGGKTLEEIETELVRRGPRVKSTGRRHPGATQMEFTTRLAYAEREGNCAIVKASVSVRAKMILPRWGQRAKADGDTRLIWDTLSADIKRHEESHVIIAKNHARELEQALKGISRQRSCQLAAAKAKAMTEKILTKHDRAQDEFDRIEGINFESRIIRLLRYRMERIEAAKTPG
jgi:predicted secreted Zn-dependent protease